MIGYSQCWEDPIVVKKALEIGHGDNVISVTSGGCNVLSLAAEPARHIYAIDKSAEQNYLFELKLIAIKHLSYLESIGFLGYTPLTDRLEIYHQIKHLLKPDTKTYWDSNPKAIQMGVVHCGRFEGYVRIFQQYFLSLVHSESIKRKVIEPKDKEAQITFYETKWNTFRWRFLFKIFFSRFIMSRKGRNREMFSQKQKKSVGDQFFKRIEKGFKYGPLTNNFYLNYLFFSNESQMLPDYLKPAIFEKVKDSNHISIHTTDILSFLKGLSDNSIHKLNLSDIFEPMDLELTYCIFNEILRVAAPNARLIFWNNLVDRDVPTSLVYHFERDNSLEDELQLIDHVFFYERFLIYKIVK